MHLAYHGFSSHVLSFFINDVKRAGTALGATIQSEEEEEAIGNIGQHFNTCAIGREELQPHRIISKTPFPLITSFFGCNKKSIRSLSNGSRCIVLKICSWERLGFGPVITSPLLIVLFLKWGEAHIIFVYCLLCFLPSNKQETLFSSAV